MRAAIGSIVAWILLSLPVYGQGVTDNDRRGFKDLSPIFIDLDGDGKPERIQPRTYQTYNRSPGKRLLNRHIKDWITFDIKYASGKFVKSIFAYNYGTPEVSYWVYALIAAGDVNKDGRVDLMFYSGDDTSDETVILLNKEIRFPVHSRKVTDAADWFTFR